MIVNEDIVYIIWACFIGNKKNSRVRLNIYTIPLV